jgi:hypothetical protein
MATIAARTTRPVIDTDQLGANAKKLGAYCATHPDTKLIAAAGALFERE